MIELFEGRRAKDYDKNIPLLFPGYETVQESVSAILRALLSSLPSGKRILVAGCGTGTEMLHLLDVSPNWHITGFDPSPEMIRQAAAKLECAHDRNTYELISGTVSELPELPVFDAATLLLVLHFLPDDGSKLSLLREIGVRLTPGAPFIMTDIFGSGEVFNNNMLLLETLLLTKLNSDVTQKILYHIKNDVFHCTEERQLELLKEAGFVNAYRFHQTFIYGGWVAIKGL
jgi:tRNA (cmo5U34)-methyltransferase